MSNEAQQINITVGAVAAIALSISAPGWAVQGKPCSYQDLMPAYESFATATLNAPPEERAAAFVAQIAARFPDYYSPSVYGDQVKLKARALRFFSPAQSSVVFPGVTPLTPQRLTALARSSARDLPRSSADSCRHFQISLATRQSSSECRS